MDSGYEGTPKQKKEISSKKRRLQFTDNEEENMGGDGSSAGSSVYSLKPFTGIGRHVIGQRYRKRRLVNVRLPSTYPDGSGPRAWVFPYWTVESWFGSNILEQLKSTRAKFTSGSVTLSNLIITQDQLNVNAGTAATATTFNDSPFCYVTKDKFGTTRNILAADQYNSASGLVAAGYTGLDYTSFKTFETNGGGYPFDAADCTLWKMQDDAITHTYNFNNIWVDNVPTIVTGKTYMPMVSPAAKSVTNSAVGDDTRLTGDSNIYPLRIYVPSIPTADGLFNFSLTFMVETDITYDIQTHPSDGVPVGVIGTHKLTSIGAVVNLYNTDVRFHTCGDYSIITI